MSGLTWLGEELTLEPVGDVTKPSVADPGRCSGLVVSARQSWHSGGDGTVRYPPSVDGDSSDGREGERERGDTCRGGWRWVWQASLLPPSHPKDPVL